MPEVLSCAEIITLAERESGAYGLTDAGLHARVTALVDRFNARGPYRGDQIEAMQAQLRRMLANRLKMLLDRQRFPAIAEEQIERPIFIIGFARSGTTLLHSLLAEDPQTLSPRSWHICEPSPPPGAGPVARGRFEAADRAIAAWMDFCPAQRPMHPYIDKRAQQLCEDGEVFSLDMRMAYPFYYYRVPSLQPGDVMLPGDLVGAYRFHREFLQHVQWNSGLSQWACKDPAAPMQLEALLDVYPDALCVWAHRPLADIYASNVALRAATFDTINGKVNDWSQQPREIAQRMKEAFDNLLAKDIIDDPRVLHIPFRELAADPAGTVGKVYAAAGRDVSPAFAGAMRAWLGDPENAVDRYGRYPYSYEAFGLDRDWVNDLFAGYSRRFGLD